MTRRRCRRYAWAISSTRRALRAAGALLGDLVDAGRALRDAERDGEKAPLGRGRNARTPHDHQGGQR